MPPSGGGAGASSETADLTEVREVRALERNRADRLLPGANVGRYVVLSEAGQGAMGVVYAAFDPELNRRVAVKLLHRTREGADIAQGRLVREARALAMLAHPNVIAAYDVGRLPDGRLFLAMEYVAGTTLRAWLAASPRTHGEITAAFVQAGRGLAAAHDVGIVHRDFKPENVIVGTDGRTRVTDFGLAQVDAAAPPPEPRSVAVAGTPAYMAPEQRRGQPVDARCDQFAFAVAFHEALTGVRPSAGELIDAPRDERPREQPRDVSAPQRLPARIGDALARALSPDREHRFASMAALLARLGDTRPRWTAGRSAIVVASVLVVVFVASALAVRSKRAAICEGSDVHLRDVWDADHRDAVQRSFSASKAPYASAALTTTRSTLDAYASSWVSARTEACIATRVRGDQSDEVLTLRTQCLDRRLRDLRAFAVVLANADDDVIEHAPIAASNLAPIGACADITFLRAPVPIPGDPEVRRRVTLLEGQLSEIRAREQAGKYEGALPDARALAEAARELRYRPLEAEVLLTKGSIENELGLTSAARETFLLAVDAAEGGRHDSLAADLWVEISKVSTDRFASFDEAAMALRRARAALERSSDAARTMPRLLDAEGMLHHARGRDPEAVTSHERAVQEAERLFGKDHLGVAELLQHLGSAQRGGGDAERSVASLERSLAIYRARLGSDHPSVASVENSLALSRTRLGQFSEARAIYERSLTTRERAFGPDHVAVAESLTNLATMLRRAGQAASALPLAQRALAIYLVRAPDSPWVANLRNNVAFALEALGRLGEARAEYERACEAHRKHLGPDHPEVSVCLGNLASVSLREGHAAEAASSYRLALAMEEKARGPEHVMLAIHLTGIGRAELAQGRPRDAVAPLERALELRTRARVPPGELAETRFALARALMGSGGDRARAMDLAGQARLGFIEAGKAGAEELPLVEKWLVARGR